jgi:L,D-transpeptidase ErfK/SrfK
LLVGGEFEYPVVRGDTWQSLGSRYGIDSSVLAALNGDGEKTPLRAGRTLRIDNRHLVPATLETGLVINIPQRMLFFMRDGAVVSAYPVAVGRRSWPTFTGRFTVTVLERDPVWDVPPSIQDELRRAGKEVLTHVPPGPTNPLGNFWIGLSAPNFGIHGTIAPHSIYRFETHGCIRLHPDDIADLWPRVAVGMPGEAVYEPVLVREVEGRVMVEAHADVYRRTTDHDAALRAHLVEAGLFERVDWKLVTRVLAAHDGRPHFVEAGTTPSQTR